MKPRTVQLQGGPFDGCLQLTIGRETICAQGDPIPEGQVARYRPTADADVYAFVGYGTVLETLRDHGSIDLGAPLLQLEAGS